MKVKPSQQRNPRMEKTDRWRLIEYWFRRESRGNDEHFKLVGLITTSLKLIRCRVEEPRAVMVGGR